MRIQITEPKYSGEYFTEELDELKKDMFVQKSMTSPTRFEPYPQAWFFVICFKKGNKYWQSIFQSPDLTVDTEEARKSWESIKTHDHAWEVFKKFFDIKKHRYFNEKGKWVKFDAFMARKEIPKAYKDIIKRVYD